jgi:probable addiction module antidote protein
MGMKIKKSSSSSPAATNARKRVTSKKRNGTGPTSKRARSRASRPYESYLQQDLADPREAAAYLTAAIEDEDINVFLLALRDVAQVHGGLGKLSSASALNRRALYRMLSERGNPALSSLDAILKALGFQLAVGVRKAS